MRRPPHPPDEGVLARGLGLQVLWMGLLMAGMVLAYVYAVRMLPIHNEPPLVAEPPVRSDGAALARVAH